MTELLLFRLFGPFASWGEVAVGEVRPSALRPTRSALLGLLAAALGLERQDEEAQLALAAGVRFAVRIDSPGVPAVDYHTVNYRKPERKEVVLTRADELRVARDLLSTVQSWRHYRCDALFTVAVAPTEAARYSLALLQAALERPVFPLSLGRKACVPALPLGPQRVAATTLLEAFAAYETRQPAELPTWYPEKLASMRQQQSLEVCADAEFPLEFGGPASEHFVERRDEILSRRRWRFSSRRERVYSIARRSPAAEEVRDVSQSVDPG